MSSFQTLMAIGMVIGLTLWIGSLVVPWVKKNMHQPVTPVTNGLATPADLRSAGPDDRLLLLAYMVAVRDRLTTTEGCPEVIDKTLIPALMAQKKVQS